MKVFIVMGSGGPVAAFTSKSELKEWLYWRKAVPSTWMVYRMRTGGHITGASSEYDVVPMMELLK